MVKLQPQVLLLIAGLVLVLSLAVQGSPDPEPEAEAAPDSDPFINLAWWYPTTLRTTYPAYRTYPMYPTYRYNGRWQPWQSNVVYPYGG